MNRLPVYSLALALVWMACAGKSPTSPGTPISRPITPIFRMDCSASYPHCGWPSIRESQVHNFRKALRAGAGPGDQDVVEFAFTPNTVHQQHYVGWEHDNAEPPPSQGVARYVRYWIRILSPLNLSGNGGLWGNKLWFVGDTGPNDATSRVIGIIQPRWTDADLHIHASRNVDGYDTRSGTGAIDIAVGMWHAHQFEITSSRTLSSGDGRIRFWSNNDRQEAPTTQTGGTFQLDTTDWGDVEFGYFVGETLNRAGSVIMQLCCFEYDDEFDPNWYSRRGRAAGVSSQ